MAGRRGHVRAGATPHLPPHYTLVIAEKPRAAARIADALGLKRCGSIYGVTFWCGLVNGEYYVVAPTAGHLFSLKARGYGYPIFDYEWVPRWEVERGAGYLRRFYAALKYLASKASKFINACDYDIEGSVIGFMIIKEFGGTGKALRAKFSSLTKDELREAFAKLDELDSEMVEAGLCRHELDWMWGINVSRALMDFHKRVMGKKLILSAGRVQSPTLVEALKRQIARDVFVPEIVFNVTAYVNIGGEEYKLENSFNPPESKFEAEALAKELRREGSLKVIDVKEDVRNLYPPPPFNLPDLQAEAARAYGISPAETLRIAENLYLDSLISYPRTNSQKLPPTLNNRRVLESLGRIRRYEEYVQHLLKKGSLHPREGRKTDPAHPAIYPTGYLPRGGLKKEEWLIYDLIVRRYIASFYPPASISRFTAVLKSVSTGLKFILSGQHIVNRGWLTPYPFISVSEREVPAVGRGCELRLSKVRISKTYSKPPQPYSKASLLRWMESVGIGTEATRADIIETLFRRGYLRGGRRGIEVTELGYMVVLLLTKLFTELTSVELTREFERKLESVRAGQVRREEVVMDARKVLEPRLLKVKETLRSGVLRARELIDEGGEHRCAFCGKFGRYYASGMYFCELHFRAYTSLVRAYGVWRRRAGVGFREFLQSVVKLRGTGRISKEVARKLLEHTLKTQG